jgi:hypothetical protein
MKIISTPKMTLPCGVDIETHHFDGSTLVSIILTNLSPGSVIIEPGGVRINIALTNLPALAELIQKYLPKKSRKRKRTR